MTEVLVSHDVIASQHLARGIAHFRQNQFAQAVAAFDAALQFKPDDPYAHWNRATALLSMGDYARGFAEHDWAWRLFHWRGFSTIGDVDRLAPLPLWRGERNVRLLAYHELGFGDAIMAFRYLPEIKRRAEVTLMIDASLVRLARTFDIEVKPQLPDDLSQFDCRLPFFGVMAALQQTAATIPAAPYIETKWHQRAGSIGIAWSGRTQTAFTAEMFLSRLEPPSQRCSLHALQPGDAPAYVEPLFAGADFVTVANRIAEMEHIVSVDTAAIHLAGAMGHPSAHLVLPFVSDWRWWHTELWYPRLHSYRQPCADDWATPFKQLNEALDVDRF